MTDKSTIIYTHTDEAPALATRSLLPIIRAFTSQANVSVETRDISLAGRILATFTDDLLPEQQQEDALAELGCLAQTPDANIIKLPNISASVPQLKAAIAELQAQGCTLPDYPDDPETETEQNTLLRYNKVKGSAVNPVLREGNSDRRAPGAVKQYARTNPHSMGAWSPSSRSHVATMEHGDFRNTEQSMTLQGNTRARIEHTASDGTVTVLRERVELLAGEIIDSAIMEKKALIEFLERQISDARERDVLFSLHMKATMMKVSDPIIFGHAVRTYFKTLFELHGDALDAAGVDVNNGLGDVHAHLDDLSDETRKAVEATIKATLQAGPAVAMVNSDKGITNLHVPSDVIIDASMPAMIRTSGQMWNAAGEAEDAKAVIPDSSYASVYEAVIAFCKEHGAFDPTTMGSVPNVGLMAQKAEEYGSHDKTYEIQSAGVVRVLDGSGNALTEHAVEAGDIWRMCQVKDLPIQDWVKLAVRRARESQTPAVFWLDADRRHDAQLIKKVETYLQDHDTEGLELQILSPRRATEFTLRRLKEGQDTISVTGNVLRDYLTDLFPILEVGTSAKMLSIVPLMEGGGLFETGAGGSAPKHVQQFNSEGHLRWDSLGEFLALGVSLEHLARTQGNAKAGVLATTLDLATTQYLLENKSPSRRVNELDNRGSHFYLALYWAQALSEQTDNADLNSTFRPIAGALAQEEDSIVQELLAAQGEAVDIGGYYRPDDAQAISAMRPSETFNQIIDAI